MQKRRKSRLGTVSPIPTLVTEEARKERRNKVIDLSKYDIGFDAVKDINKRKKPQSSINNGGKQYSSYRDKLEKGLLDKFSTRDIMYFYKETSIENGVNYVIANPKKDMRVYKLALERGYTNEEILSMIEFLFTSGQTYLDIKYLHPGILLTGWCNRIYEDTKLWLNNEYDPNPIKQNKLPQREWDKEHNDNEIKIGEWDFDE